MKIKRLVVGNLEENCYILEKNNKLLIVDPGDNYDVIRKNIGNKEVVGILITHYHFDHIGALNELMDDYNVPIYDYHILNDKTIKIGDFCFKVIHTFGHTNDSVTFDFESENVMFTGDFIFKGSIGRTDLETGDMDIMKMSIEKIKEHHNATIYPGHGESTTLNDEKKYNIYFS